MHICGRTRINGPIEILEAVIHVGRYGKLTAIHCEVIGRHVPII